ncbi:hypothetical protein ACWF7H_07070 [Peribacillus butanolivorans]|uniref:hypothetical protein n=1 Tax=Peribacillus butanolivorans TaxID=421767 RepID=UPI0036CF1C9B
MNLGLKDKTALVTGGSKGIGKAIAVERCIELYVRFLFQQPLNNALNGWCDSGSVAVWQGNIPKA